MNFHGCELRCTADELTLDDYLNIIDVLDTDQYDEYVDQKTQRLVRKETPRDKGDRSDNFMFGLHQKIVRFLSDMGNEHLAEKILIDHIWEKIEVAIWTAMNNDISSYEFKIDDEVLKTVPYSSWKFKRWMILENDLANGIVEFSEDTGDEQFEIVSEIPGNRLILASVYGDPIDSNDELLRRVQYFNHDIPILYSLPAFYKECDKLKKVRNDHGCIYNSPAGSGKQSAVGDHFIAFRWLETLRSMMEFKPFGTYIETKESPLFEVLEYLNTNSNYYGAVAIDQKKLNKS